MNKKLAITGGVVATLVALVIFLQFGKKSVEAPSNASTNEISETTGSSIDACTILTEGIAKQVLGDGATKGNEVDGNSTDDIAVSNCNYTAQGATIAQMKGAGVLVRTGITQTGKESNISEFRSSPADDTQEVDGLGDEAHFNASMGQLNILKNGNWYIVSNYTGTNPTKATLEQVKQLADLLEFN